MLVHWIWLATRPGVSDRLKVALLESFQDPEDIFYADPDAYAQIDGVTEEIREALQDKNLSGAEEILEKCEEKRIRILTIQDAAYPKRLKNIPDPPTVLYYKGRIPDFDGTPTISVVGTRKASAYGLGVAKRMGYEIAMCGGIVVSGAATGIDGCSMQGALTAGGTVVGVLGCGADVVYPVSNKWLYADTERYGCLLTEFPPGTPPYKWNFPRRNRIISGLGCGVLVIEAPEISGALITARAAAEQGRDVFAVPGNIDMPTFVGSNKLLREGAIMAVSGWDVMSEYESLFPGKIRRYDGTGHQAGYADEVKLAKENAEKPLPKVAQKTVVPTKKQNAKQKADKKAIDNGENSPYIDLNKTLPALNPQEQSVVNALAGGQRLVDDVIAETGISAGKMLGLLTMLEIKGVIRRLPGRFISLKQGK